MLSEQKHIGNLEAKICRCQMSSDPRLSGKLQSLYRIKGPRELGRHLERSHDKQKWSSRVPKVGLEPSPETELGDFVD